MRTSQNSVKTMYSLVLTCTDVNVVSVISRVTL
jgi:hypothetical protein